MTSNGVPVFNEVPVVSGDSPTATFESPAILEGLFMTVRGIPDAITSIEVKLVANPGSPTEQDQNEVTI